MSDLISSRPEAELSDLIARHGRWPVLAAALRAVFQRHHPPAMPCVDDLPDDLRRDIGLPPRPAPRPSVVFPPRW